MLKYKDLIKKINSRYFKGSCTYSSKNELQRILLKIKPIPTTIVEIGTFYGLSTLILAGICDVHTFDVRDFTSGRNIWNQFETKGKITKHIVKDSSEIAIILKDIDFDFAFVDVVHEYRPTKEAFELVKHCDRVLLHDNFEKFPGVMRFCEEIECKRLLNYFGYWENE